MPEYSAFFASPDSGEYSLEDRFAWWKPLAKYMLPACDSFQLDCQMNDLYGLQCCAKLGAAQSAERVSGGSIEIWSGYVDKRFAYELINDPFDEESQRIKWYNVFLRADEHTLLSITQNGEEVGLHKLDEQDIAFLQELTSRHGLALYYWENASSGSLVPFLEFFQDQSES